MDRSGFRRRILIEPSAGVVTAELEDDWHRMVVTLHHADDVVHAVERDMKRWPWTSCRGALDQVEATFVGVRLSEFAKRGGRALNCTHLYDLAQFAAAHADDTQSVAYDVFVSDPIDGRRDSTLKCNGTQMLGWTQQSERLVAPDNLAGLTLATLGGWIAAQDKALQEAARILRWASILALGRSMDIPTGTSAQAFPGASCYTFQPEVAVKAKRLPGAHIDFAGGRMVPMADRANEFA